jgi:hypothetical protein
MHVDSPVVQISNLDFRFDSHLPYVLRDVSMTVHRGRCDTTPGAAARSRRAWRWHARAHMDACLVRRVMHI